MVAKMIKLECITNMHVGNGDVNYNLIDNEVEKDPVTGYPTINASGVKGALREFLLENANVNKWFGSDEKGKNTKGLLKVLGADMLTVPLRASKGNDAYYLVTTEEALNKHINNCEIFFGKTPNYTEVAVQGIEAEGIKLQTKKKVFDKELHIIGDEAFRKLSLPVMARNKLDNGKSSNLWFEEVVPHKSIFTFMVLANECDKELLESFKSAVDGKVIQFGGSASIGYGLCKVAVIEEGNI